ncbi:hypothetical protein N9W89_13035 [Hellea sp.]|nr:hypothetical protein [Hellea sp.]
MIKLIAIILASVFTIWSSSAAACSYYFPYCDENGRCVSEYRTPIWMNRVNLIEDFDFIAVAKASKKSDTLTQYGDLEPHITANIKVKKRIKGKTPRIFEQSYLAANGPDRGNVTKDPSKRFGLWDHMKFGFPGRFNMSSTSCGPTSGKALSFGDPYLIFGKHLTKQNGDIFYNISQAVLLSGLDDSLIEEIESIVEERPDAANRMDVKTYLSHMTGFAELTIQSCPTEEQTYYTDSLYANAKGQNDSAYRITASYNYGNPVIDIRDISSYRDAATNVWEQLEAFRAKLNEERTKTGKPSDGAAYDAKRTIISHKCESQQQFLAIFRLQNRRDSLRYLPIQNGTVDLKDVLTNIVFDGPTRISVYDAQNWIRKANPK